MRKLLTSIAAPGACAPLARSADRVTVSTLPGSSNGYQAFVGYDFNRHLAIETDDLNIGNFSAAASGPYPDCSAIGTLSLSGATASVLGKLPLTGRFARVGGLYWRGEATAGVVSNGVGLFSTSASNSGAAFIWGGGGEAFLGPFALRAGYQQTDLNGHTYRFAGGSLIYRF